MIPTPYDLIIGLDRADPKADLCLIDPRTGQRRRVVIATAPEALWEWLLELRQHHPTTRVGLCLEQPAVHLVPFLEAYDWITLHPIHPITLQKYREAFVTSRAKDDTKDAEYLADLLWHHHAQLPTWTPQDRQTRAVQQLVVHRRTVVDERTGLTNRLIALLKQYFPQALTLCGEDLWRPLATAFLLKWPSLAAVQKTKPATLKAFYYRHGSRSAKLLTERLALIEKAVPVTDETAVIGSFALRVQLLARELQVVVRTIAQFDRQIAAPLQCYTGVAPGTKRSGGSGHIHRRYCCPKFHQQSFHEYAKESIRWSRWAGAFYRQQRSKGCSHHTAVRVLAFKWQRVIWRCWQDRRPYNETRGMRRRCAKRAARWWRCSTAWTWAKALGNTPRKNPKKVLVGLPQR